MIQNKFGGIAGGFLTMFFSTIFILLILIVFVFGASFIKSVTGVTNNIKTDYYRTNVFAFEESFLHRVSFYYDGQIQPRDCEIFFEQQYSPNNQFEKVNICYNNGVWEFDGYVYNVSKRRFIWDLTEKKIFRSGSFFMGLRQDLFRKNLEEGRNIINLRNSGNRYNTFFKEVNYYDW